LLAGEIREQVSVNYSFFHVIDEAEDDRAAVGYSRESRIRSVRWSPRIFSLAAGPQHWSIALRGHAEPGYTDEH